MNFHQFEKEHLDSIDERISSSSEMTQNERRFLNGLIRYYKPKKILEVGIAAGSSSVVILNAIADREDSKLYSVDYSTEYYRDRSKKSGFMVQECVPDLMQKWELRTGGVAARFMDEIGGDIDMCFMDTTHHNPGEYLDFLMVLPYLKKDCLLVLHDIAYHIHWNSRGVTCGTLISVINGKKIIPEFEGVSFPNIGAAVLDREQNPWDIFNLLSLPWVWWHYLEDKDWDFLKDFMARYYDRDMQVLFGRVIEYKNRKKIEELSAAKAKHTSENGFTAKNIVNFVKSYLFFPWYTYKTYKKVQQIADK